MILTAFDKRLNLIGNVGNNKFQRLPDKLIKKLPKLDAYPYDTSGIRLSFFTNSKNVGIKSSQNKLPDYMHINRVVQSGYDIYINKKFEKYMVPLFGDMKFENEMKIESKKELNLVDIYFPLYGRVDIFSLILDDDCEITPNTYSKYSKPIVFYGSSITQGGCACRNGLSYASIISTMLDTQIYNLGFSGRAKGEKEMAEYISKLDMSLLVYDYDHNSPNSMHLAKTHEPFFRIIRKAQPDLPIIMVSRGDYEIGLEENTQNRRIIMQTYLEALNEGDKNVYFIDGKELFKDDEREFCTVDKGHPNTLGFYRMAKTFLKTIKEAMGEYNAK